MQGAYARKKTTSYDGIGPRIMLILLDSVDQNIANTLGDGVRSLGATMLRWTPGARNWPETKDFFLLTDANAATLARYAADMRARKIEPRRTIVRAVATQRGDWVYHDLPVFASIVPPSTSTAASDLIRRLARARAQDWIDPPSTPSETAQKEQATHHLDDECERLVKIAASSDIKVLLIGETGTGKSTLARRIHELSGRSGPLVSINCAALPETLIESELFGVEAGAFTGAVRARPGKFELADRGTLFLDEIDSLPLHLQAKLLSAIQDGGTTRLGDHRFRASDFRLITASQVPLEKLVSEGKFRADLMHRVAVIEVKLPPVRHLGATLINTFESMLQSECQKLGLDKTPIEPSLYPVLLTHDWPGNFRELAAAAQRCAVGLPPLKTTSAFPPDQPLRDQLLQVERELVRRAIETAGGSLRTASEALGLPLETLRYRIKLLGLQDRGADRDRPASEALTEERSASPAASPRSRSRSMG